MSKTNQLKESEFVPYDLAFHTLFFDEPMAYRIRDFIEKHNIIGTLTWERFEGLDKQFADEYREYITENKERIDEKYTKFGTSLYKQRIQRQLIDDIIERKKLALYPKPSKKQVERIKSLMEKELGTLTYFQLKAIIMSGQLDPKDIKKYYKRYSDLKELTTNYNKPQPIKVAKALITFNFSGKSNPVKWVDYEEIIKAKLYCVKMGMQYLEKKDLNGLKDVQSKIQSRLDDVLDLMGYKDINEIKF